MAALPMGSFPVQRRPALRLVVREDHLGPDEVAPIATLVPAPAGRRPAGVVLPVGRRRPRPVAPRGRRFVPGLLTIGVLAGLWWGTSALSGLSAAAAAGQRAPGATLAAGQAYVVRTGDTLWSIAVRLDPSGDPRPIVDQLASELDGSTLQPGEVLRLP